jgi:preprotein translocase subunit SecA
VRHLTDLDVLREGIGLRAYGQQNPLVAFKKEAFDMYEALRASIQHDVASLIYHVSPAPAQPARRPLRAAARPLPSPARGGAGGEVRQAAPILQTNRSDGGPARSATPAQIGRNDPCYCGSGRKYKNCHMREDQVKGIPGRPSAAPVAEAPRSAPSARAKKRRKR